MLNGLFAIWSPVIYRKYLRQCYKSVLLGWYTLHQNRWYTLLQIYWYTLVQNTWYTLLQIIQATSPQRKLKVGFDACCVSGVFARTHTNTSMVDACDAGRFSMYVSEDLKVYPCSFQSGLAEGDQLDNETTLRDIWTKSRNMGAFRSYFSSDRCGTCSHRSACMNGCPLFDELVVCGKR